MTDYASYIDSTLLKPDATQEEISALCKEARGFKFKSVCVNPSRIALAKRLLEGSGVGVVTVIGFPLGATLGKSKAFEAKESIREGADEVDMVINIGKVKDHDWDFVTEDIREVREAAGNHVLKVILECCLLTDEEKVKACECAARAKADFVKTSTGFAKGGATVHDVSLMAKAVRGKLGVKAAGGIRDGKTMLALIQAGATRIGTSHGAQLLKDLGAKL